MEISLAGIEEALAGLGYRETSPKARLIRAIHTIYKTSTSPGEVRAIDSDELIDQMWNLEGDRRAIRSRRKNLSSIKSSVNQDLDSAWEEGRNPEGITIGPLNTFVMSDAAKDKILNSFSGSMDLDGGKSLDQVAEALKIVSDYLSEMPTDVEGEQLSNLKSLIEGLSEKFKEDGEGGVRVIEKIVYRDASEGEEGGPAEGGGTEGDVQAASGEGEGEADDVEPVDEADLSEEVEEIEEDLEEGDGLEEVIEFEDGEFEGDGGIEIEDADDLEVVDKEEIGAEDAEDLLEIEEEGEAEGEGENGEDATGLEDELEIEASDEVELVDEADLAEEVEEIEEGFEEGEDLEEVVESEDTEDLLEIGEEGEAQGEGESEGEGENGEDAAELEDELEIEASDEVELVDEADLAEEVEEIGEEDPEELLEIEGEGEAGGEGGSEGEGGDEIEIEDADDLEFVDEDEVDDIEDEEASLDDSDAMGLEDGEMDGDGYGEDDAGGSEGENVVELVGAEGLEDADEVEIVYEDEPDDVEEVEADDEIDESVEAGADEVELMDEDDVIEEETDELDETMTDVEVDDAAGDGSEDLEFVEEEDLVDGIEEDSDEIEEELAIDEADLEDAEDIEWMGEDDVIDAPDDFEEVVEEDVETEGSGEEGDEDIVELVGAEGLEEADEVELVDEDDLIEEADDSLDDVEEITEDEGDELDDDVEVVEEEVDGDEEPEADETMSTEDTLGNNIGLPIDQLMEDLENFEEFQLDEKQKRLLAERFDGYLGAMERYYNQYIFIKKGNYHVGADAAEEDVLNRQQVLMSDYYMGKYPVTNALFEVFIERTGYKTTAEKLGYGYVYHGRFRKVVDPNTGFTSSIWNSTYTREKVKGATWYQPLGPGSTLHKKRNHPVVQVSIQDARTFSAWTGKRLPSEIEWEAAARSRAGLRYPWGNDWIEGFSNFENSGISDTCPVDHFPHSTNEEGLADLLGNVMEWTSDECEPKYPLETPARFFIAKGGSWVSPEQTALFSRSRLEADFTSNTLGFRCLAD